MELEGDVDAMVGRGTCVADISQDLFDEPIGAPDSAPEKPCENPRHDLSRRGRALIGSLGYSSRQSGAFMPGLPDVAEFPFKAWNRIQSRHWRRALSDLLTYAPAGGHEPLRYAVSEYLTSARSSLEERRGGKECVSTCSTRW